MEVWDRDAETSKRRCQTCGSHVSAAFRRTYGDETGTVHACIECSTYREMKGDGAAIATDGGRE